MRLTQTAREKRDDEVDKLTRKYDKQLQRLEKKLRKAEASLDKKKEKAGARKREMAVSVGESVLGMFMGRRSTRSASTALSKYRQSKISKMDVEEAEETVEALQEEIEALEQELKQEVDSIAAEWDEALAEFEEVPVRPRKKDVQVDMLSLAWLPHWSLTYKDSKGTAHTELAPAY
jgi:prefoldin subunit 5